MAVVMSFPVRVDDGVSREGRFPEVPTACPLDVVRLGCVLQQLGKRSGCEWVDQDEAAKVLREMYDMATASKHGYWYIDLVADEGVAFYKGFDEMFVLQ